MNEAYLSLSLRVTPDYQQRKVTWIIAAYRRLMNKDASCHCVASPHQVRIDPAKFSGSPPLGCALLEYAYPIERLVLLAAQSPTRLPLVFRDHPPSGGIDRTHNPITARERMSGRLVRFVLFPKVTVIIRQHFQRSARCSLEYNCKTLSLFTQRHYRYLSRISIID